MAGGSVWDLEQTSQFIVVAATLLDLKAARLLPSGEMTDAEDLALLAEQAFGDEARPEEIRDALAIFLRRFIGQQFKRNAAPDGPKVGTLALSPRGDWRCPSDLSPAVWCR